MKEICCNCFVKEDMWTSSDVVWRPIVDFPMLDHAPRQQNRACRAGLRLHRKRRPVAHLFMSRIGSKSSQLLVPASSRDEERIRKCCSSNSLVKRLFLSDCRDASIIRRKSYLGETFPTRDQFVEEPWLLQSSLISESFADLDVSSDIDNQVDIIDYLDIDVQDSKFFNGSSHSVGLSDQSDFNVNGMKNETKTIDSLVTNYPVEEPWLFESTISMNDCTFKMTSDLPEDEAVQSEVNEQHHSITENLLLEEESNSGIKEDSVSTVILINSSVCTMQRIAVLENAKLVELLLEPVKTNVQCDSVYLGVVTKLVPHMGGAFVNIGSPRPSFMAIKDNREPFILSSFQGHMKEREVSDSLYKSGEEKSFLQNGTLFNGIVEPDALDDVSEDESIDDEFGDHDNRFHFDVLELIKENVNGSVIGHGRETGGGTFLEELHEDLLDVYHSSSTTTKEGRKWKQVQKGSKIIVQVVKEGLGTKEPTLTAYPKLKSRFWILMTRCKTIGISKKIAGVERMRLRDIAKALQPSGFGLTVRTVASGHSLEELQKDLESLLSTWKSIVEQAKSAALAAEEGIGGAVPVMLHRAMGQTLTVVQDYFNEKVKSLVVDSPRTYHEVTNYLQEIAPNLCERLELYSKKTPLFDEYNIEGEINNILGKRVPLDNGGYLVIEQTEALVSIDVNGGQCMLGQGTSQEKAVLEVNLAAAKQIARELRLRDIGGIIVVDFIDMWDDSNKRLVYEQVKKAVEMDRSTVTVSELSRHGLMEIIRKRVRPSVTFMISEPCTCCQGTGRVEALDTSFSKIERDICRHLAMADHKADRRNPKCWPRFILRVDRHMCNYLTSGKKTKLAELSSSLRVWILLKVARGLTRGSFEVKPLTDDNLQKDQRQAAISVLQPTEVVRRTPKKKK